MAIAAHLIDGAGNIRRMFVDRALPVIRVPVLQTVDFRRLWADPITPDMAPDFSSVDFKLIGECSDRSLVYVFRFAVGPQFQLYRCDVEVTSMCDAGGRWLANLKQLRHLREAFKDCRRGPAPVLVRDHVRRTWGHGYRVTSWFVVRK